MRHTVYKLFISTQYEKEEKWINEMSAKGQALVYAGLCRYIFEDAEPGEFVYRIELLNNLPSSAKSISYLQFLEDTGVQHISSVFRWVYLRKRTEDGPFDLYSDIESTIRYFKRLQFFFIVLTILELIVGIQNLLIGAFYSNEILAVNLAMGILLLLLGVVLAVAAWDHTRKLRELRREKQIRE